MHYLLDDYAGHLHLKKTDDFHSVSSIWDQYHLPASCSCESWQSVLEAKRENEFKLPVM